MSDGSGPPSWELLAMWDRISSSWKTCLALFPQTDWPEFSATLPDSGSMRNGFLSERPMWEPPTSESEFLFWPSARGEDSESCGNHPRNGSAHSGDSLTRVARNWPTVYGQGAGNSGPDGNEFSTMAREWQTPAADSSRSRGLDRRNEMGLDQQARFWPTPTEDNVNNQGGPSRSREGAFADLTVAVQRWPTAGANDHKGSAKEGQRRGQLDEAAVHLFSPPGPADPVWRDILCRSPYLAPAIAAGSVRVWWDDANRSFITQTPESLLCGVADGHALVVDESRADQLRAIGNGVVALQAAVAFRILARRFRK
jgi:DNA (cytosine-5)-methyltransferase 1